MAKKNVCMIVQDRKVMGGIAAVVNGYYSSKLEEDFNIKFIESYKDGSKLTKILKSIKGFLQFIKYIMFNKIDLLHIHSSFGPSFYRKMPYIITANWLKIPVVNHIHGADFDSFYADASKNKKKLVKRVYNRCSMLIVLSDDWYDKFSSVVDKDKISVVENYGTLNEFSSKEKCANRVLFLGAIGERKGGYDIPEIAKLVCSAVQNVKFIIAGTGKIEDLNNIKAAVERERLTDNVEFVGWIRGSKKDEMLKSSDLFLLPSYNEGMPMSILEAMSYGLPVVSTVVGGIPKIVRNGINGYCEKPGDKENIAKRIIDILTDDEMRLEMGRNSYNILKNEYSLEQHIEKIENIWNKVLSDEKNS